MRIEFESPCIVDYRGFPKSTRTNEKSVSNRNNHVCYYPIGDRLHFIAVYMLLPITLSTPLKNNY